MTKLAHPVLEPHEVDSPVWRKIKQHCEQRLDKARIANDKKLDATDTATLRGRIAELMHLAALDQPAPRVEADDQLFRD